MHDATAARAAGITSSFHHFDLVEVLLDDGYLGLSRDHPGQALTPPRKPRPEHCPAESNSGNAIGTATHPTASPSSTPWPITNAGSK
jgi:hypothetical protein